MTADRPAHRPSRRSLIMRVALEEICREGDTGELPTVGAVAETAGVTSAAIYYHFPSRADLLIALVDEIQPQILEVFSLAATDDDSVTPWSERFFHRLADWAEQNPNEARFYFLIAPSVPLDPVAEACTRTRTEFLALVSLGMEGDQVTEVRRWIHSHAIREIVVGALELAMQNRTSVPRGFHALRQAGTALAAALLSPATSDCDLQLSTPSREV